MTRDPSVTVLHMTCMYDSPRVSRFFFWPFVYLQVYCNILENNEYGGIKVMVEGNQICQNTIKGHGDKVLFFPTFFLAEPTVPIPPMYPHHAYDMVLASLSGLCYRTGINSPFVLVRN